MIRPRLARVALLVSISACAHAASDRVSSPDERLGDVAPEGASASTDGVGSATVSALEVVPSVTVAPPEGLVIEAYSPSHGLGQLDVGDESKLYLLDGHRFLVRGDAIDEADSVLLDGFDEVRSLGSRFAFVDRKARVFESATPLGPLRLVASPGDGIARRVRNTDHLVVIVGPSRGSPGVLRVFDGSAYRPLPGLGNQLVTEALFADHDHILVALVGGRALVSSDAGAHFAPLEVDAPIRGAVFEDGAYRVELAPARRTEMIVTGRAMRVRLDGRVVGPWSQDDVEYGIGRMARHIQGRPSSEEDLAVARRLLSHLGNRGAYTDRPDSSGAAQRIAMEHSSVEFGRDGSAAFLGGCRRRADDRVCVLPDVTRSATWEARLPPEASIALVTSEAVLVQVGSTSTTSRIHRITRRDSRSLPLPERAVLPVHLTSDGRAFVFTREGPGLDAVHVATPAGAFERIPLPAGVRTAAVRLDGAIVGVSEDFHLVSSKDGGRTFARSESPMASVDGPIGDLEASCDRTSCAFVRRFGVSFVIRDVGGHPAVTRTVLGMLSTNDSGPARSDQRVYTCRSESGEPLASIDERLDVIHGDARVSLVIEEAPSDAVDDEADADDEMAMFGRGRATLTWRGRDASGAFEARSVATVGRRFAHRMQVIMARRDLAIVAIDGRLFRARPDQRLARIYDADDEGEEPWLAIEHQGRVVTALESRSDVHVLWIDARGETTRTRLLVGPLAGVATIDGSLRALLGGADETDARLVLYAAGETGDPSLWKTVRRIPSPTACGANDRGTAASLVGASILTAAFEVESGSVESIARVRLRDGDEPCVESVEIEDVASLLVPGVDGRLEATTGERCPLRTRAELDREEEEDGP